MFVETIHTPGLASLSYVIGADGVAAVIDPRRDIDAYLDIARERGVNIRYVIETHRHEDFVVGSCELAKVTGADILHGEGLDFEYGKSVGEGATLKLGDDVVLKILRTPGHTDESISIVAYDKTTGEAPLGVFTGDALFVNDVGRTDFYPERAREVAGLLYDSIHDKLLPLGDQVILWPAHGAGSVCGDAMADRNFSTLGYERRHNPMLQLSRKEFIDKKVNEEHVQPPYFRCMEKLNQEGTEPMGRLPEPQPIGAGEFRERMGGDLFVIDVRTPEAFAGCHIPDTLSMPLEMLPAYGGWFMPYDRPIGLVAEDGEQVRDTVKQLVRLGYENVECWLRGGVAAWEVSGAPIADVPAISVEELKKGLESKKPPFTVLDVRKKPEYEEKRLPGSTHIFLGELNDRIGEVPKGRPVVTFCGSGKRALIAASILKQHGIDDVRNSFGSMKACQNAGCPTEE